MKDAPFSFQQTTPDLGSQEITEAYIRRRAHELYEQRGREDGHDLEDWLQAEAEILGRKPAPPGQQEEKAGRALRAFAA